MIGQLQTFGPLHSATLLAVTPAIFCRLWLFNSLGANMKHETISWAIKAQVVNYLKLVESETSIQCCDSFLTSSKLCLHPVGDQSWLPTDSVTCQKITICFNWQVQLEVSATVVLHVFRLSSCSRTLSCCYVYVRTEPVGLVSPDYSMAHHMSEVPQWYSRTANPAASIILPTLEHCLDADDIQSVSSHFANKPPTII